MRNVLSRVPLFSLLSDAELDYLRLVLKPIRLDREEVLFRQGAAGDSMIVVFDGQLSVRLQGADGTLKAVSEIQVGEVVGEMSCIDPAPRSATVVAARDTLAHELNRAGLSTLETAPSAAATIIGAVIRDVSRRLRVTNARLGQEVQEALQGDQKQDAAGAPPRATPASIFGDEDLALLAQVGVARSVATGQLLCQEGEEGHSCFFVKSGEVEVLRTLPPEGEMILATLGKGALLGQMALIDAGPRSATLRARVDTEALELERAVFEELLKQSSPLALRLQEQIARAGIRQLRKASERLGRYVPPQAALGAPVRRQPTTSKIMAYVQTALQEWDMSLDRVEVVKPGP